MVHYYWARHVRSFLVCIQMREIRAPSRLAQVGSKWTGMVVFARQSLSAVTECVGAFKDHLLRTMAEKGGAGIYL